MEYELVLNLSKVIFLTGSPKKARGNTQKMQKIPLFRVNRPVLARSFRGFSGQRIGACLKWRRDAKEDGDYQKA
jgi:hypothetical protein